MGDSRNQAAVAFLSGISLTGSNNPAAPRKNQTSLSCDAVKTIEPEKRKKKGLHTSATEVSNTDSSKGNIPIRASTKIRDGARVKPINSYTSSDSKDEASLDYYAKNPSGKLYFAPSNHGVPYYISSVIYISDDEDDQKRKIVKELGKELRKVHQQKHIGVSRKAELLTVDKDYDPTFLDDPTLTTGRHSTVMNYQMMRVTTIPYVKKSELKEELNDKFKEQHPNLKLKLTSIRSIKKSMLQIGLKHDLDIGTIAHAYVYFERLVLKGYVTSENKKQVGAVCLVLAAKFYHYAFYKAFVHELIEIIEKHWSIKDVIHHEVPVFIALNFDLVVDPKQIQPHYTLLLERLQRTTDAVIRRYRNVMNNNLL